MESAARTLPNDIDVERAVLSALLHDNTAIHAVLNEVKPEDFYHPAHQQLYRSMIAIQDANEPVDLHTLGNALNEQKLLDAVGGAVYLAELFDYAATAANVETHARIVRDKSVKRGLISVATDIVQSDDPHAPMRRTTLSQGNGQWQVLRLDRLVVFVSDTPDCPPFVGAHLAGFGKMAAENSLGRLIIEEQYSVGIDEEYGSF